MSSHDHTPPASHTPAPWTLEPTDDPDHEYVELRGDSGSKPIADIFTSFYSDEQHDRLPEEEVVKDKAEYAANARLIAAAPVLLEALERLLQAPDVNLESLEQETYDACDFAYAAIETVKGD